MFEDDIFKEPLIKTPELTEININLDNPIFVHYVSVGNLSRQKADSVINDVMRITEMYKNVTFWVVPINGGDSRIECVYEGGYLNKNKSDKILKILEDLMSSNDEFKSKVRDIILSNLLGEENNSK